MHSFLRRKIGVFLAGGIVFLYMHVTEAGIFNSGFRRAGFMACDIRIWIYLTTFRLCQCVYPQFLCSRVINEDSKNATLLEIKLQNQDKSTRRSQYLGLSRLTRNNGRLVWFFDLTLPFSCLVIRFSIFSSCGISNT